MKKLNNKGFTLIELLAVIIILVAIMSVALPVITTSLEKVKVDQNEKKKRTLEAAAEIYVTDNKENVYSNLSTVITNGVEYKYTDICFNTLISEGYISKDTIKDSNGEEIKGYIRFTVPNKYEYTVYKGEPSNCYDK